MTAEACPCGEPVRTIDLGGAPVDLSACDDCSRGLVAFCSALDAMAEAIARVEEIGALRRGFLRELSRRGWGAGNLAVALGLSRKRIYELLAP